MKIIDIVKRYSEKPNKLVVALGSHGLLNWVPDKLYLKLAYRCEVGEKLNLEHPETFTEKIQWLKLYDRKPEYTKYADKYEVQDHIKQTIGEQYLIPMIGVYNTVEEINWDLLPERFVLKCTHGSGTNIICTDKSKLDIDEAKDKLNKYIKTNWFWFGREWPYKNITPRIICQEFMASETNKIPDDYKVMCFNGKAKFIVVHKDRYENHMRDIYDENWNKTKVLNRKNVTSAVLEKPLCFDKMIRLSEILAADFYHVRIDWFIINNKLYFTEITFHGSSGFNPYENKDDNYMLGNMLKLSIDE